MEGGFAEYCVLYVTSYLSLKTSTWTEPPTTTALRTKCTGFTILATKKRRSLNQLHVLSMAWINSMRPLASTP